jgi:hypothetical protein
MVRWRAGFFFETEALMGRRSATPHRSSAGVPRAASSATTARNVRSGFSAIRANSHSRSLFSSSCRQPILYAAALPVARKRCDHFSTLATLTPNNAAVARHERPAPTEPTTQSRKSCE